MKLKNIAIFLTGIYFFLLLVNINKIPRMVGDENIYSASTTALLLGSVDSNNHPLLAKTIWSYFVFLGNGYFGSDLNVIYRIGTVILSILGLLVFFRTLRFFFNEKYSFLLTILLAVDPMYFVFSRLMQLEIPALFFILSSLYYFLKFNKNDETKDLFFSATFLGFSLAVKLSALAVFVLLFFYVIFSGYKDNKSRKLFFTRIIGFFILVVICFVAGNFIYFFKETGDVNIFIYIKDLLDSQLSMQKVTDGFQISPAWSFFTVPQILTLYRINLQDKVEAIIAMQNPLLFLITIPSVFYTIYSVIKNYKKDQNLIIVLIFFSGLYLPWFFNLHTTFYYYITPLLPLVILMFGKFWNALTLKHERYLYAFLGISVIVFLLIYPLLVGIPVPKQYDLKIYNYSQYKYPEFNTLFCQNCYPRY